MSSKQQSMAEVEVKEKQEAGLSLPCVGRLAGCDASGEIVVEYDGRSTVPARVVSVVKRSELADPSNRGREVCLIFEQGDPARPIIVGVMEDRLETMASMVLTSDELEKPKEMVIDGERLVLEGKKEIVFRCGSGSITLRKDGKIVIRGTHILSRSSGPNRIKGGSVQIN